MTLIERKTHATDQEARQFALIWLPIACAVFGGLTVTMTGAIVVAAVIWGLAATVAAIELLRPGNMRPVYVIWMGLTFPIGWVMTHLILALVFFLVIMPIGLLLRVFGYDPMCRTIDRSARTYWIAYNPGGSIKRYFRQV